LDSTQTIHDLPSSSELIVDGPRIHIQLDIFGKREQIRDFSVLNRIFDLRQHISTIFHHSPFEFDLTIDRVTLDDEISLAQTGLGPQTLITLIRRKMPSAHLYFADPADKRIIVDVENPENVKFGELARQLTDDDPKTVGFEYQGKAVERYYAVSNPRNETDASRLPFVCPPRDPIELIVQDRQIAIVPESGSGDRHAVLVEEQTAVGDIAPRLGRYYPRPEIPLLLRRSAASAHGSCAWCESRFD
jgi:hypothetical protein